MPETEVEQKENCRVVDGRLICDDDKTPAPRITPSGSKGLEDLQLGKMTSLNCNMNKRTNKWECSAKTEADKSPSV